MPSKTPAKPVEKLEKSGWLRVDLIRSLDRLPPEKAKRTATPTMALSVPNVWPLGNLYNIWKLDPAAAGTGATSKGAWYFERALH
jgi:hypothetical protein